LGQVCLRLSQTLSFGVVSFCIGLALQNFWLKSREYLDAGFSVTFTLYHFWLKKITTSQMQVQVPFHISEILALCSLAFCIDFASQQLLVKNTNLFAVFL